MKNRILAFCLLCLASFGVQAAPGDTTWVQANSNVIMDWANNFDTTVKFPSGSVKYRKILMYFKLGEYACPSSATYCADWDYTVSIYCHNKKADTVELGRLITPYGKGPRLGTSYTWSQDYLFDVTDFAPVLTDSNKIRINYSGYSGGFTANIRFAFIEGTPDRDVLKVQRLWNGYFAYGSPTDPIDNHFPVKSVTAPTGTEAARFAFKVSGHGADPNYCSEFCAKWYRVIKDGSIADEHLIWRDNCGFNQLYPQNGTWIYDRANWCPGASVGTIYHNLNGVKSGTNFSLAVNFQPYSSSGDAGYGTYGMLMFYGGMNKTNDASLETIMAPNADPNYFRLNSRTGFTTIKLHNSGSAVISSVSFEYGVVGDVSTTYTWKGNLQSLADTVIDLPFANSLLRASGATAQYSVAITSVNGGKDEDATNDKLISTFVPAPEWPTDFTIMFRTNASATASGYSETDWKVIHVETGKIVASRVNNAPNKTVYDTLHLATGVYKLAVTDAGCDGLSWWANASAGSGQLLVKPTLVTTKLLEGYFGGDFGCGFDQYFRVGVPVGVKEWKDAGDVHLNVFPNPATDLLNISIGGLNADGVALLTDQSGRTVSKINVEKGAAVMPLTNLQNGVYFVQFLGADADMPKLNAKVVILR